LTSSKPPLKTFEVFRIQREESLYRGEVVANYRFIPKGKLLAHTEHEAFALARDWPDHIPRTLLAIGAANGFSH